MTFYRIKTVSKKLLAAQRQPLMVNPYPALPLAYFTSQHGLTLPPIPGMPSGCIPFVRPAHPQLWGAVINPYMNSHPGSLHQLFPLRTSGDMSTGLPASRDAAQFMHSRTVASNGQQPTDRRTVSLPNKGKRPAEPTLMTSSVSAAARPRIESGRAAAPAQRPQLTPQQQQQRVRELVHKYTDNLNLTIGTWTKMSGVEKQAYYKQILIFNQLSLKDAGGSVGSIRISFNEDEKKLVIQREDAGRAVQLVAMTIQYRVNGQPAESVPAKLDLNTGKLLLEASSPLSVKSSDLPQEVKTYVPAKLEEIKAKIHFCLETWDAMGATDDSGLNEFAGNRRVLDEGLLNVHPDLYQLYGDKYLRFLPQDLSALKLERGSLAPGQKIRGAMVSEKKSVPTPEQCHLELDVDTLKINDISEPVDAAVGLLSLLDATDSDDSDVGGGSGAKRKPNAAPNGKGRPSKKDK